jgi:hypothetical protein
MRAQFGPGGRCQSGILGKVCGLAERALEEVSEQLVANGIDLRLGGGGRAACAVNSVINLGHDVFL